MLRQRVATAIALLVAFLTALFFLPPMAWLSMVAAVIGIAAWEWSGLAGLAGVGRIAYASVTASVLLVCGLIWDMPAAGVSYPTPMLVVLGGGAVFWLLVVPLWLAYKWPLGRGLPGAVSGWLVLMPAGLALVQLRGESPQFLLAAMALVWVADIGAYFVGRAIGRHKMAPGISPGKSWEGAFGGAACVVVYGFAVASALPQLQGDGIAGSLGLSGFAAALVLLTALSIVGDLFESLAKRQAGVKDSGHILPGHGGLLDRIDSLTSTLPLIALALIALKR